MRDMDMLEKKICDELDLIANKGFTPNNLEMAYKLIDIYKDIKEAEYYEGKASEGYSERPRMSYGGTHNSYGHDDMMSREYDKYMDNKASYRYSGTNECKTRVLDSLDDYLDSYTQKLQKLMKDADCPEERDIIKKYIYRIKENIH